MSKIPFDLGQTILLQSVLMADDYVSPFSDTRYEFERSFHNTVLRSLSL